MLSTTPRHPNINFFEQVVQIVKLIPYGRVTTYGAIANCLGSKQSARMVGWALNHTHKMPEVPAHRVVNRQGNLTGKHHFEHTGSMQAQLAVEGIVVKDDQVQDMRKVFWDPEKEIIKAPTW
ncbi:MAG: MGMT family protein [Bacteroidota bacterium]